MDTELQSLNERYAIPGHISFHSGPGGLVIAVINNVHASAVLTLQGGHIMTYTPHGGKPLLWVSPNAAYEVGKAMRGGIPVCWPWFGSHPQEPDRKLMHGFARTQPWSLAGTRALDDGGTEVRLVLRDNAQTWALWPQAFELELTATVGRQLDVQCAARNPGSQPYQFTGALHPYFLVSAIREISITGLVGTDYLDKTEEFKRKSQSETLRISGWTDRIYLDTTSDLCIEDPGFGRTLRITKTGSRTTVVWNPDVIAAEMPDVGAGQQQHFVCVETANAVDDVAVVAPGGEARLGMTIEIE
jgi:glucose-6-phosphate 1-epimerase